MSVRSRGIQQILSVLIAMGAESALGSDPAVNDGDDSRAEIEEIVIEGERATRLPLKDASHSIVVLTREDLERGTDRDMRDILQRVPNVTTNPFSSAVIIRGVATSGLNNRGLSASSPTTLRFADGFSTAVDQPLWDAQQVEVLRGPESYLSPGYIGGVSAVNSTGPGPETEGKVTTSWSPEQNDRELGVAYGGPVTQDLDYRVAAHLRASDGLIDNVTLDDDEWNGLDERMLRLMLAWHPDGTDDHEVNVRVQRIENRWHGSPQQVGGPNFDPFDGVTTANEATDFHQTDTSLNLEYEGQLTDAWSTIVRVWRGRLETEGTADGDNSAAPFFRGRSQVAVDASGISARLFYDSAVWHAYFRQFVALLEPYPSRNEVAVNGGAFGLPGVEVGIEYSNPTANHWYIGTQFGVRRELGRLAVTAAIFRSGQTIDDAERGVRFYRAGSTGDATTDAGYDSVIDTLPTFSVTQDLDDYNYLPSLVVDYALTDAVTVGAKYERTARLAGVWFNPVRGTVNTWDDEIADGYELFLRGSWLDGRLTVRTNAFHTELADQQVFVQLSGNIDDAQFLNAPHSHNDGLEIETSWTQGAWNCWFSAGLLHAEIDDAELFDVNASGNDFPYAPDWTLAGGVLFGGTQGLFVEMDAALRPEAYASLDNVPGVVSQRRFLINARVGVGVRTRRGVVVRAQSARRRLSRIPRGVHFRRR